jgi:hypothetical protein
MYFVWEKDSGLAGEYSYFTEEPEGYSRKVWISGEKIEQDQPKIVIVSNDNYSTVLTDLLLTQFEMQIASPGLVKIFENLGIENVDYYPVKIINHENNDAVEDYKAIQIIGNIECLDAENSVCSFDDDGDLMWLTEFSLKDKVIQSYQKSNRMPHIFRLAEFPYIVLADESLKNQVEKEGITGIKFVEPLNYEG